MGSPENVFTLLSFVNLSPYFPVINPNLHTESKLMISFTYTDYCHQEIDGCQPQNDFTACTKLSIWLVISPTILHVWMCYLSWLTDNTCSIMLHLKFPHTSGIFCYLECQLHMYTVVKYLYFYNWHTACIDSILIHRK